ncbi:MAG TPA: hypothetical protein VFC78_17405 [Tepidisphaeraceae bacterium]|nr:hypothetical protein [Tepidisphaeraceae bacterium]
MRILITEDLRNRCLRPFGIRDADVIWVAEHPEQSGAVSMGGGHHTTALFAGWPGAKQGDFAILLSGKIIGDDYTPNMAFKVPPDIAGTGVMNPPLQMLKELAERFGLHVAMGTRSAKFIVSERIKVASYQSIQTPTVQNPENLSFLLLYTVRPIIEGGQTYADCNLCFALRLDAYRQAIGELPPTPFNEPSQGLTQEIELILGPGVLEIMQDAGVTFDRAQATLWDRHSGMLLKHPGCLPRMYVAHWFDDGQIVFVQGDVCKSHWEGKVIGIDAVTADLVLASREELPAGTIERDVIMNHMLLLIARSFGVPITCHPHFQPALLQSGPWDGHKPMIHGVPGDAYLISGAFSASTWQCELAWAFSPTIYLNWWNSIPKTRRRLP